MSVLNLSALTVFVNTRIYNNPNRDISGADVADSLINILQSYPNVLDGGFVMQAQFGQSYYIVPTDNKHYVPKKYVDDSITALSIGSYLPMAGGTMSGNILFANNLGIDSVVSGTTILNIGTSNADTINIGNSGATINILGTTFYENVTNLTVTDKLITLNKGGASTTGTGTGFEIEENSTITGYFKTNTDRLGYDILVPANSYKNNIDLSLLTSNRKQQFPDKNGTFAMLSDIPSSSLYWDTNGNTVGSEKSFGTIDNYGIPIITNNVGIGYMSSTGSLAWGTTTPFSNTLLSLKGSGVTIGTNTISLKNSSNTQLFRITDDGSMMFGGGIYNESLSTLLVPFTRTLYASGGNAVLLWETQELKYGGNTKYNWQYGINYDNANRAVSSFDNSQLLRFNSGLGLNKIIIDWKNGLFNDVIEEGSIDIFNRALLGTDGNPRLSFSDDIDILSKLKVKSTLLPVGDTNAVQFGSAKVTMGDITQVDAPTFVEFFHGDGTNARDLRASSGFLGGTEFNNSINMDYTTNVHKYYDTTHPALWSYMGYSNGFGFQYVPANNPNTGDIWTSYGCIPFKVEMYLQPSTGAGINGFSKITTASIDIVDSSNDAITTNPNSNIYLTTGIMSFNGATDSYRFDNKVAVQAGGASSIFARAGGVMPNYRNSADAGNTTTTETDLYSDNLSANILSANGNIISGEYVIDFAASATATRDIRMYFAGTLIFDSGSITTTLSSSCEVSVKIIRTNTTTARASVKMVGTALTTTNEIDLTGQDFTIANILKITGQAGGVGAATNDIVAKFSYLEYK